MGMAMMGSGVASGENRAIEAAEAAIRSPLLEDVNIQGARGILVNITAGLDLSLGEFSDVGDTVKEFASDQATVVVGTVIDPEMHDELRVTVVATGLDGGPDIPLKVVENKSAEPKTASDYRQLDRPTVMRQNAAHREQQAIAAAVEDRDMEYLDIPAFLRRQAD